MTLSEIPNHQPERLPAYEVELEAVDPLWQRCFIEGASRQLGALGVAHGLDPETDGRPEGMHRVGIIDFGGGETREALIGGLGVSHVALPCNGGRFEQSLQTARSLVLQMLESQPPGSVKLSVYNGSLTDAVGGFNELGTLYESIPPHKPQILIDNLADRHNRLANQGRKVGTISDPWHISLIIDKDNVIQRNGLDQLNTLVAAGPQYGSIITIGVPLKPQPHLHDGWYIDELKPDAIRLDPAPSLETVRSTCRRIAIEARQGTDSPELKTVMTGEMWGESARDGIYIPFGINVTDGSIFEIGLDNMKTPHAIITGRTGSGKSNILNALIASMTYRYDPDNLKIDLLDYKMGVEFTRYATHPYLPHARLVGEKIDKDPEFGIAALEHLQKELEKRGRRAQQIGASTYAELYDDPDNNWPQIVTIIDEFHVLLKSELGPEAAELMLKIAKQGRVFGVHLVLASQSVADLSALYDKNEALFTNINLRIATDLGTMFNPYNNAADHVPDFHALVNQASGDPNKNFLLWLPDASDPRRGKRDLAAYQRQVYDRYEQDWTKTHRPLEKPRIFNGLVIPTLESARDFQRLKQADLGPRALLAQDLTVADRSVGFRLSRDNGKNIAVLGSAGRRHEVNRVMYSAAVSLGKQQPPELARFSLVCLDRQSAEAVDGTADMLRDLGHTGVRIIRPEVTPEFLAEATEKMDPRNQNSHYVFIYGADASGSIMRQPSITEYPVDIPEGYTVQVTDGTVAETYTPILKNDKHIAIKPPTKGVVRIRDDRLVIQALGPSGSELLYELFEKGPESGVHVIASFSGPDHLRHAVTHRNIPKPSLIGSYVSIGIQPSEMNIFTPDLTKHMPITGLERENRGLFYDRTRPPRIVRMYASPGTNDELDDDDDDD